jgi:DNA-directed RNA polymerase subunit N (RpoN/RPB10)
MPPNESLPTDGSLDHASELMDRVEGCLIALRTGDNAWMIEDTIDLVREVHSLAIKNSADGIDACLLLEKLLRQRLQRQRDDGLLEKVISLLRDKLVLSTERQADRATSCKTLANYLVARYEYAGDVGLLDEAIALEREALGLHPAGSPNRALSCGNLAASLTTRYERTGDLGLLDEAMDLQREALGIHPAGSSSRASCCGNLAYSLKTCYECTGDLGLLDEAIGLERETLDLHPAGNPVRASSCGNLANSLRMRYESTDNVDLLDEAIDLQREVLGLCHEGHPDRGLSCGNLASSLMTRYQRTGNVDSLDESRTLFQEAITISPVHTVWRFTHRLAWTLLQDTSPFYDVRRAILSLSQSLENGPDDPLAFVLSLSFLLDNLWQRDTEGKHIQLTTIFQRLVSHLPLLIHPALGLQSQLHALKRCTQLGSDAFVNAALADDWSIGLETLELAQGVIWSTSLHRRDPQLKDVPGDLASRLHDLLQSLAIARSERVETLHLSARRATHSELALIYCDT